MPTVLTRDQIKAVDDRQFEFVKVPEWAPADDKDAGLWVLGLSGTDRDDFDMTMIIQRGRKSELNFKNLRARLVVRCAVDVDLDAEGNPIRETAKSLFELKDVAWLGQKSGAALQRVYALAQRLSGLSAEDVEELTAELGEAESDGSGSDSPLPSGTVPSLSANNTSAAENSASGWPLTDLSRSETADSTS